LALELLPECRALHPKLNKLFLRRQRLRLDDRHVEDRLGRLLDHGQTPSCGVAPPDLGEQAGSETTFHLELETELLGHDGGQLRPRDPASGDEDLAKTKACLTLLLQGKLELGLGDQAALDEVLPDWAPGA